MNQPLFDEFKKIEPPYYKIINNSKNHRGMIYKLGLNEDILPFNPKNRCSAGGLYFTNKDYICNYFYYGNLLCEINLCEDSKIWYEGDKAKTDKFIIVKIHNLKNMTQECSELINSFKNNKEFKFHYNLIK